MNPIVNSSTRHVLEFTFPLPRPLTGIALGNGAQGLLIWGKDTLNITIARNGFWDHRGMGKHHKIMANIGLEEPSSIKTTTDATSLPPKSYQLGGARLVLHFPDGLVPERAIWRLEEGKITVVLSNSAGRSEELRLWQAPDQEAAFIELPKSLVSETSMELIPAWKWIGGQLEKWGIVPPCVESSETTEKLHSVVQSLPADPALAIAVQRHGPVIAMATALGKSSQEDPLSKAKSIVGKTDSSLAAKAAETLWRDIMARVPHLDLPDPTLTRQYHYGLARLVGCTLALCEDAPACSLQGPFMEDDGLPPWSNDYHMNINVQMNYWPLLQTNLHENFAPLWKMLRSWLPDMQRRGEACFEKAGAFLMPTAPDDHGCFLGADHKTFGNGKPVNDHNSLAWMARLAWLHYRYSNEERLLNDIVWPLLNGAFEGYWSMIERKRDSEGKEHFSMPYTMSPEYHKNGKNWGRDSSFQLAACHSVVQALPKVAELLGEDVDARWAEVAEKLLLYKEIDTQPDFARSGPGLRIITAQSSDRRIGVWEDEDYSESHRHHSHLAAFYPFETLNPHDPELSEVAENSYNTWTLRGTGFWTGWSFPWASILCSRYNRPTAAVSMLHQLETGYTNEGGNTGHDGAPGVSLQKWRSAELAERNWRADEGREVKCSTEIIQMDAALGAVSAIMELLVQARPDGVVYVLPALPVGWYEFRFDGICCPGGFRIGATVRNRTTTEIRIGAMRQGTLRVAHGMGDVVDVNGDVWSERVIHLSLAKGDRIVVHTCY